MRSPCRMDHPAPIDPRSPAAAGDSSPPGRTCGADHRASTPRSARSRECADLLSRRCFLQRTSVLGAAALVASALPLAERLTSRVAYAADPSLDDATPQASADTINPVRKVRQTDL